MGFASVALHVATVVGASLGKAQRAQLRLALVVAYRDVATAWAVGVAATARAPRLRAVVQVASRDAPTMAGHEGHGAEVPVVTLLTLH